MFKAIFPHAIDNSMRKELVKCQTAAMYRYEKGLRTKEEKRVDLVAGAAFAAGMEAARKTYYVERKSSAEALNAGVAAIYEKYGTFVPTAKTNKTVDRMAGALAFLMQERPLESERLIPMEIAGKRMIEVSFNFPIPVGHPDDGKPLTYCGRFDMLALDEHDVVWVVDEKTTSQMGEKWANQWPLDSQMTGYCWGARKLLDENGMDSFEVAGAIINGVAIRTRDYEFAQFPAHRDEWMIHRWHAQMVRDVENWKRAYMMGEHDMALDHACAFYNNPCEFAPLCMSRNPERLIASGGWKEVRWNPVTREEEE